MTLGSLPVASRDVNLPSYTPVTTILDINNQLLFMGFIVCSCKVFCFTQASYGRSESSRIFPWLWNTRLSLAAPGGVTATSEKAFSVNGRESGLSTS